MFSRRLPPHAEPNALSRALDTLRAAGAPIADLTESNPTRAAIPYPGDLLASLADAEALRYEPHPFGLSSARDAVAEDQRRRGARVDPAHVVLTASTSEAYSWLFKLLCNPGEAVLVPRPSYPLFEHLTALEGVRAHPYALEYDGRWAIDVDSIAAAPPDVRAVLVVSPNNPTGSYLNDEELPAHRESLPGPAVGADRRRGVCGLSPRRHEPADRHCRAAATCCRSRLQACRRPWGCRR